MLHLKSNSVGWQHCFSTQNKQIYKKIFQLENLGGYSPLALLGIINFQA